MQRSRFEIQHQTLAAGWVNTWSDENGEPIRFVTRHSAEHCLRKYLRELKSDTDAGIIGPYDETEFRIAPV